MEGGEGSVPHGTATRRRAVAPRSLQDGPLSRPPGSSLAFPYAAQPDIVRASQKDELYLVMLTESCKDAIRRLLGPRAALQHSDTTAAVAAVLYYGLTTGCGSQTLGEEYCDLLQVYGDDGLECGPFRRSMMVLLQAAGPVIVSQLQRSAERQERGVVRTSDEEAENGEDRDPPDAGRGEEATTRPVQGLLRAPFLWTAWARRLVNLQGGMLEALACAGKLHLSLFYFTGAYYAWAHRAAGVRHLFAGQLLHGRPSYRLLGAALLIQVGASAWQPALDLLALRSRSDIRVAGEQHAVLVKEEACRSEIGRTASHPPPVGRCALCLSPRQAPTATSCGHVFCWGCITEWCNQKLECPICRTAISTPALVRVYNGTF